MGRDVDITLSSSEPHVIAHRWHSASYPFLSRAHFAKLSTLFLIQLSYLRIDINVVIKNKQNADLVDELSFTIDRSSP